MPDATYTPHQRFYRGLGQRGVVAGDRKAIAALDQTLLGALNTYVATCATPTETEALDGLPPRRIAVSMALAIFSQPHLVNTFREPGTPVGDALLVTNEVLELALGLSGWELDDLRDEVDRRAGTVLKQATLVRWLTTRYSTEQLIPLLLPGSSLAKPGSAPLQGHLYLLAAEPASPPSSLYLPWLQSEEMVRFRGRYADSRVKLGMARGIGISEQEAIDLLERSVTLIPHDGVKERVAHDRWRRSGIAALTRLGASYCDLDWLTKTVEPADVRWRDWVPDDGEHNPHDSTGAFDALVKIRVHHTLHAAYTDVMAHRIRNPDRITDELITYDLTRHLQAVLSPLLAWTRTKGSATWLAEIVKQDPEATADLLYTLHTHWTSRMEHWTRPPVEQLAESPFGKWMASIAAFDAAFSTLLAKPSDLRFSHADVLPLFAAHFIAENPVSRTLMTSEVDVSSPGPTLAKWFWPTWQRLLDTIENHAARTDPEFVVPEGMF